MNQLLASALISVFAILTPAAIERQGAKNGPLNPKDEWLVREDGTRLLGREISNIVDAKQDRTFVLCNGQSVPVGKGDKVQPADTDCAHQRPTKKPGPALPK
jgi:hypothetical protein